ncbi:phosphotransferase family protein, partial [Rhizobiaceae sp. 2RAB30]
MLEESLQQRLAGYLAERFGATSVEVRTARLLSGGTLQENWRLELSCLGGVHDGDLDVVLRASCANAIPGSLSRAEEFEVLQAVHGTGVTVPEPLLHCVDTSVIGKDFLVTRVLGGSASPGLVTRSAEWGGDKETLARRIGEELGRMQTIRPCSGSLPFLPVGKRSAAEEMLEALRTGLPDDTPRPILEWGLRWLEANAPAQGEMVLTHGDFRTGNFMVDGSGLT